MYNRQPAKGTILLLVSYMLIAVAVILHSNELLAIVIVIWVASIADAAVIAGRLLRQQRVSPWAWF